MNHHLKLAEHLPLLIVKHRTGYKSLQTYQTHQMHVPNNNNIRKVTEYALLLILTMRLP